MADQLALPFSAVEPSLKSLTTTNLLDALGLAAEQGPWLGRPLPERMAYAITRQGRTRSDQIGDSSTRYAGPAPVSLPEYRAVLAEAAKPGTLDLVKVNLALSGIELAPGVTEAVRAAVNSRSSIFIYGAPGNGKTTLARRIPSLLGAPIVIPVALDIGGVALARLIREEWPAGGDEKADRLGEAHAAATQSPRQVIDQGGRLRLGIAPGPLVAGNLTIRGTTRGGPSATAIRVTRSRAI